MDFYLLALDRPSDDEREAVQRKIKEVADVWWHEFADIWIVAGGSTTKWRDLAYNLVDTSETAILVLDLPRSDKAWGFSGRDFRSRTRWLHVNYTKTTPSWDKEDSESDFKT